MNGILPHLPLILMVLTLSVAVVTIAGRLKRTRSRLSEVEGEETRMFDYLHDLGLAIGTDTPQAMLYRKIVEGIKEVVGARGGAIYLLDEAGEMLQPKFLSEDCPPLVGVPLEIRQKAVEDPRALESYLRLSQVPAAEGVFGAALGSGDAIHVRDVKSHESFRDAFLGFGGGGQIAALIAPLKHSGKDLGVLAVAREPGDSDFSPNDVAVFRSAAEQSAFALGNALLFRDADERRQFERDLRNASEVQRVLLPQSEPKVPGFRVFGTNVPARIISGDYYDHLELENGLHGVVIADVSGKGVAAGLMMAMCRSVLRCRAGAHRDPVAALAEVNRQLFPDIREDMFISLFYGVIDGDQGVIRLARAGHDAALLYRAADRSIEKVKPPGLALGIDEGDVFERVTRVLELQLAHGDCLLFYTDGVKEAINTDGDEFGMARLREVFLENAAMGAESVVTAVEREVAIFSGDSPQMDDITLLAVEKR